MALIDIQNVSKTFGDKDLFIDTSFTIDRGDKVALIGKNGCGKSTLLKIIAGMTDRDSGDLIFEKGIVVSILSQNQDYNPDSTISEHLFKGTDGIFTIITEYEKECAKIGTADEDYDKIDPTKI